MHLIRKIVLIKLMLVSLCFNKLYSQSNPTNLIYQTVQTVPTDETRRATNTITLSATSTAGFKYGAGTSGSRLTLQISENKSFVENSYINPPTACGYANFSNPIVGEIDGNFSVSLTGSAMYEIPVKMSPGTAGMQPNISMVYSSGSGSGTMGLGWNLSGLSAISRINKTPQYDTKYDAIKLTTSDVFALDGNRMTLTSGSYGGANSTYGTLAETFTKVTAINQQGNGPQYFVVVDKNGTTTEYGNSIDSKLTGISDNTPLAWYANKITDIYGNFMEYHYKQLNGEMVIERISYTGNPGAIDPNPYNEITFEYILKTERNTVYIGDKEFKSTQLLRSITAKSYGNLVKKYVLNYLYNSGTLLNDVTEINYDGSQLKSTVFCYDDPYNNSISQYSSQNTNIYPPGDAKYSNIKHLVSADFNGDGFSDAIVVQNFPANKYEALRNDYPTGALNGSAIGFTSIWNATNPKASNAVLGSFVMDTDFDDKQEVYTIINDNVNPKKYHIQKLEYSTTSPYITVNTIKPDRILGTNINLTQTPSKFYYDFNDYTGDGINDELIIDPETITIISSSGTKTFAIGTSSNTSVARPFDLDGDGTLEIILFNNSLGNNTNLAVDVIKYTTSTNLISILSTAITFPTSTQDLLKLVSVGDYNGDGKGDILYLNETKQNLNIKYSTGSAFSATKPVTSFSALNTATNYSIMSPDINGDGTSDIIFTENNASSSQNYKSYYSMGDQFVSGINTSGKFNYLSVEVMKAYPKYGTYKFITEKVNVPINYQLSVDYNGDGVFDVVSIDINQTQTILNTALTNKTLFLSRVTTGLNKQIDILYGNARTKFDVSKVAVYQTNTGTYTGSLVSHTPGNYLVSLVKYRNTNMINLSKDVRYFYKGAIYHKYGKGFLGFESSANVCTNTLLGSISSFTPNATYQVADATSIENGKFVSSNVPDNIIRYYFSGTTGNFDGRSSKTTTTYQITQTTAPSIFVAPSVIDTKDFLSSTASITNFSYSISQNGSLINKLVTHGWPTQGTIKTENTSITYQNIGTVLYSLAGIFKPQSQTYTSVQTGESPYSRTTNYIYDGQKHLINTVKDPSPSNLALTTTFSNFNVFGAPEKTTLSASDIQTRSSESNFDPTGRFIIKTTNAKNDIEEFTYDAKYGNLLTKKDISGLTSSYTYDILGRTIKTQLPDNTINTITYEYVPQPSTENVYKITTRNEGEAYFTKFYNHLGDLTGTETEDVNGNIIVSNKKYDYNTGFLIQSNEPHFSSTSLQPTYLATKYIYDPIFSRLKKEELYSEDAASPGSLTYTNKYTQYEYNAESKDYLNGLFLYNQGFITITDNTNKKIIKTNNAAGQLINIKNYEGFDPPPPPLIFNITDYQMTSYAYHSNGQAKSITLNSTLDPTNIVHSYGYNALAQQTVQIDPSAGTTNYTYSKLDELLHEDDATGYFDLTYDNLGRIETKTGSASGLTSYQYVTNNNGKYKIEKITGQNVTTEYTYDALGRPTVFKETVAGSSPKVFTTLTEYDKYSRVTKNTYPSGFIVKYNYNANGFLTTISDNNNNSIWHLNNQNALGQITDYTYGNGINTLVNYTDQHYLSSIEHGSLHKQEYIFDPLKGNLTKRDFYNYVTGTHNREQFNYDGLERLRESKQLDPLSFDALIQANNVDIDEKGNIMHKDDAGDYAYGNTAKPFTLTQINNPTPNIPTNAIGVLYNDLKKVSQLTDASAGKEMNFTYGNDDERIKVEYNINTVNQYTRYYQSNYEQEVTSTNTKHWTYIYAPTGLAAVFYRSGKPAGQLLYALTDHLGSPVLLTNQSQVVQEEYSFDSWGRRRNPSDWSYTGFTQPSILNRGFTFHEHLDEFGLINMNARVYDPVIARFMQPDNYVQASSNLQNFNRYAYVWNNPLKYSDPDGNWVNLVMGAFVGAYQGWQIGKDLGKTGAELALYTWGGSSIGFLSAGIGTYVTGALGAVLPVAYGGLVSVAVGGAAAATVSGIGYTALSGQEINAKAVAKSALTGALAGTIGAGIGGDMGSFTGGFLSSWFSSAQNSDGAVDAFSGSMISGGISVASYNFSEDVAYAQNPGTLTRAQFRTLSRGAQRSFVEGREYGGWILNDGTATTIRGNAKSEMSVGNRPANATSYWHTHPNIGTEDGMRWRSSHSDKDLLNVGKKHLVAGIVISRDRSWIYHPWQYTMKSYSPMNYQNNFIKYPFNYYGFR